MVDLVQFFFFWQMTPLHSVAIGGDAGTAQVLVEKGADFNIKDNNGVRE